MQVNDWSIVHLLLCLSNKEAGVAAGPVEPVHLGPVDLLVLLDC